MLVPNREMKTAQKETVNFRPNCVSTHMMKPVAVLAEEHSKYEIDNYVKRFSSRYAAWKVFEFDITSQIPNVKQFSLHLD